MQKTVLLVGGIGDGRTTLFNKITNSNKKTYCGGDIDTRNVFVKQSFYGEGFKLIDTPGFGLCSDVYDQNAGVLSAIDNFLINRIMLVIRFDRINSIEFTFKEYIKYFKGYENKVTIVTTFMDFFVESENKEKYIKKISYILNEYNMNSIIFTSLHDSGEKLCELFDLQLKNSVAQKIQLTDDQQLNFLKNLDDEQEQEQLAYEMMLKQYSLFSRFRNPIKTILHLIEQVEDYKMLYSVLKEISVKLILETFLDLQAIMYGQEESQKYLIYQKIKNLIIEQFLSTANKLKQQDKKDFEQFLEKELKYYEVGRDECLKKLQQAKMSQSQKMIMEA